MAPEPLPSSTVILLRDAAAGLEALLLERAGREAGQPATCVFPGGRFEAADGPHDPANVDRTARLAAVRETHEEAGLHLDPDHLQPVSRWITPDVRKHRFDTWFFAGGAPAAEVTVDGEEIGAHRWERPVAALEAWERSEIFLAPPTFVTLVWIEAARTVDEALRIFAGLPYLTFRPQLHPAENGACMLYPGDAGYEHRDPGRPGPRHRLLTDGASYRYLWSEGPSRA